MKSAKPILFAAIILISGSVHAQKFGVRAGVNFSNFLEKDNSQTYSQNYNMNTGFHVGAVVDFPLVSLLSLETGVFYSTNGYNTTSSVTIFGITTTTDYRLALSYLELPILAKMSYDLGKGSIFATAGPYISYGIAGKSTSVISVSGSSTSNTTETDVVWGSDENSDFNPFDYGLSIGGGVQVNSFTLGVNYGLGLANVSTTEVDGYKTNNRLLSVSAGFYF